MKEMMNTEIDTSNKSLRRLNRVVQEEILEQEIYHIGHFIYNQYDRSLSNSSSKIRLTTKESALLRLLCLHMNELLTREEALIEVWERADWFTARSMDVYISRLRKLFKECSDVEIVNIHGIGYKLINYTNT